MNDEIKRQLHDELADIQFSSEERVLNKVKNKSMAEKWREILNKEIEIPVIAIAALSVVFIAIISIYPVLTENNAPIPIDEYPVDRPIERGGSIYWESWFNEVKKHES